MVDNIRIAPLSCSTSPSNYYGCRIPIRARGASSILAFLLLAACFSSALASPLGASEGSGLISSPASGLGSLHGLSSYYNGLSDSAHALFKRDHPAFFTVSAILIPVLVLLSGVFAGLTLGYMSLDETQLKVLAVSGTPKQQEYAKKIQPIRKNGHLLLITLLISNMVVNETLPVISDEVLGGGVYAVVISTVLIVIFSEIIPQSVCSRYGLVIGAVMAPYVRVLIWALFIIAWPVAKLLELVLGPHHGIIYRRSELKELINMHAATEHIGGDLQQDTVAIVGGALDLQEKVAADAMTPINKTFMLDLESKLDYETLATIVKSGHSRIPVFHQIEVGGKKVTKIIGILLVKQCVLLDPADATPLRDIPLNAVPSVPYDEPLQGILNRFQEGRSHMAIVSRIPRHTKELSLRNESLADAKESLSRRFFRHFGHGDSSSSGDSSSEEDEVASTNRLWRRKKSKKGSTNGHEDVEMGKQNGDTKTKENGMNHQDHPDGAAPTREDGAANPSAAAIVKKKAAGGPREQTMPADAVLAPDRAQAFIETIEGAPLGIITLEDVLEELIGEEILDEYDVTGPTANPATTYVPPEAQAAVEAAAERKAKQSRLAAVKPAISQMTTQMTNAVNAAIPSRMKAFVGVERSRSAPGRTRDGPATEGESGSEVPTEGVPVTGDEHPAEPKSASSPPVAVMHLPSEIMVPTTSAAHPGASTVNITVPAIIVQDESSSLTPQSTGSVRTTQPASGVPVHVQMQVPTDAAARRVSPAPSMLSEAILLERRRRAVAAAMSGVHTPVGDNSSNPSVATAPAAVPTPKDVEERLAGLGPRAKGARYKSSPLVAPEPGKVATAPGVAAAQTQNTGIPPTEERKED